jgi:hypothetical protein
MKTDIHGYARRLALAFEKIKVESSFTEEDKRLVKEYRRYLYALEQNPGRVAKVIFQLFVLRRRMNCEFSKAESQLKISKELAADSMEENMPILEALGDQERRLIQLPQRTGVK